MVDKEKRETQTSSGSDIHTNTPVGVSLIASSTPESVSDDKETKSKKKAHYGEYVIWFLIVLAFVVLPTWHVTREFLDKHNGAVSAISTIAIMLLTIAYVRYSRHQWQVMDGQLGQMRQQLPELHKSAQAAIYSAKAAKTNADTLINSERPWVIPKIRKRVTWSDSLSMEKETLGKPIKKRYVYFTFSVTNYGRTPAEIIAIRGNPRLTNKGINGGFKDPPDYGLEHVFMQVRMLAPGQRWDYHDVDLDFNWVDENTKRELEEFRQHRIFKGVVLYRDVFNREITHESRFCYTYFYKQENYLPSGPPDHTKFT
jgi:heme/copper-type cytochrome/quinol oxidase subunit 4